MKPELLHSNSALHPLSAAFIAFACVGFPDWQPSPNVVEERFTRAVTAQPLAESDELLDWFYCIVESVEVDLFPGMTCSDLRADARQRFVGHCLKTILSLMPREWAIVLESVELAGNNLHQTGQLYGLSLGETRKHLAAARSHFGERLINPVALTPREPCLA